MIVTVTHFEWENCSGTPAWPLAGYRYEGRPSLHSLRGELRGDRFRLTLTIRFENLCLGVDRACDLLDFVSGIAPAIGAESVDAESPGRYAITCPLSSMPSRKRQKVAAMQKWHDLWRATGHGPSDAPPAPRIVDERLVARSGSDASELIAEGQHLSWLIGQRARPLVAS